MSNEKSTAQRMTAQSKINIKAAKKAFIIIVDNGFLVELVGEKGATTFIQNKSEPVKYKSLQAAKKAVVSHNSSLSPEVKPTI